MIYPDSPQTPDSIDWLNWEPVMRATLLFVFEAERVLLIRKKRGLGAGKINGPGGKIEPGESPIECVIRETHEELRITAHGVTECGQLSFQFVDGLSLFCHVFRADSYSGSPQETDEAAPLWTNWANMPYHEMWSDDALWFPLLIERRYFRGYFTFDGDVMTGHRIKIGE